VRTEEIKKQFLDDVMTHEIVDWHEKGIIRHLKCENAVEQTTVHSFEITTWPRHLAISGDMGCFVFSRPQSEDMFKFFRGSNLHDLKYIREKLIAHERAGYKEFCEKTLDESLLELASEKGKSIESIREMFSGCGTEEEVCREYFENFDDNEAIPCCTKYTYRYLWCIHAIIWAIEQWDIMNIERGIGEHD